MNKTDPVYSAEFFRDNLKELLAHRHIRQKDLAAMMDVAPPIINNWLVGRCEPTMYSFIRLCNALNVTPDWFLRENKFVYFEEEK